jgi:hypothetical protein
MKILGLRCSNADYSFAILSGTLAAPVLEASGTISAPKGYSKPQLLKWFFQELQGLHARYAPKCIVMKGSEGMAARGGSFVERVELEAMVFYAGAELGIKPIHKKVKSQIAKGLGQKGNAKYLERVDKSVIDAFDGLSPKLQEAVLAAWSELR